MTRLRVLGLDRVDECASLLRSVRPGECRKQEQLISNLVGEERARRRRAKGTDEASLGESSQLPVWQESQAPPARYATQVRGSSRVVAVAPAWRTEPENSRREREEREAVKT